MDGTLNFVWTSNFQSGFDRFAAETGLGLKDITNQLFRILIETCYKWTPTPTGGNRGSRGGREGGLYTVAQDIYWITAAVSQDYLDMLYERFGGGEFSVNEFRKKDGSVYLIENVVVNPSGSISQTEFYHKSMRKTNGRTLTHAGSTDKSIGRWKPRNKMLMTKQARDRYIKYVQARVGKLKSGWATALDQLGSKALDGWAGNAGGMMGMSGFAKGSDVKNTIEPDTWSGKVEASNDTAYFRDLDGFMDRAHAHIEDFVAKPHFEKWLDGVIKRQNAKVIS